jgi:molecular chaperone GrpE (heat shock protein)
MERLEEKINQILSELAYLREQINLTRIDMTNFTVNLDKEIKKKIDRATEQVLYELKKR